MSAKNGGETRPQHIWKATGTALAYFGLAGLIWTASLWGKELSTLPHIPDLAGGRVYPRNIHGVVVYETHSEKAYLEAVEEVTFGTFALSLAMSLIYKHRWSEADAEKGSNVRKADRGR